MVQKPNDFLRGSEPDPEIKWLLSKLHCLSYISLCFLCPCLTSQDSTSQGVSVFPHPLPKPVFPALPGHSYIIFHLPLCVWGGRVGSEKDNFSFLCFPIFSSSTCVYNHFIFCTRVLQTLHLLSFYWEKF